MANSQSAAAANADKVATSTRPRIVFLHYTAPPIVGGVEAVIAEQARLFAEAGYPVLLVAGRSNGSQDPGAQRPVVIPEMDSENPDYLARKTSLDAGGEIPPAFAAFQARIETTLAAVLRPTDIVIAHNILSMHFNLALTAAVHHMLEQGGLQHVIAWCHDISRYVNPESGDAQRVGFPWDLLRTRSTAITYVAVSARRQRLMAGIFKCPPELIRVIPNGVDAVELLGLSPLGDHLALQFGLFLADLVILMPVRITRAKNVEFALHVAESLKQAGIRVRLIITGPPDPHVPEIQDYYLHLKQLRQRLSLTEEVVFIYEGTSKYKAPLILEPPVVGELYRLADIVLMPSLREGFGLPVLEAGLADRAIFATSVPVVEEIPEFAYLIQPHESAESVAARIAEWAASDATHRLRAKVRQDFTWEAIFSGKLMPLIEGVSSRQPEAGA